MKIGIVGQGASGVILAIMLKEKNKDLDITIYDRNAKTNKKLLATGNGRCNLGNKVITDLSYNASLAFDLYQDFDVYKQIDWFRSQGIGIREMGDLIYPFSLSSLQVVTYLNTLMNHLGIKRVNEVELIDYKKQNKAYELSFDNNEKDYVDRLIISCGGASSPNLGSNGSIFDILKHHGYKINPLKAGLTGVIVKEKVKEVANERLKVKLSLFLDDKLSYEETGEVLFKNNGLSGIAVFNANSIINRSSASKAIISLDLVPYMSLEELISTCTKFSKVASGSFLEGILPHKMAEFVRRSAGVKEDLYFSKKDIEKLAYYVKNMTFTYVDNYGFENSQVTIGGVSLDNINNDLSSKLEEGVYFTGEVLDIDGLCGGYNLMYSFASSYRVANLLK